MQPLSLTEPAGSGYAYFDGRGRVGPIRVCVCVWCVCVCARARVRAYGVCVCVYSLFRPGPRWSLLMYMYTDAVLRKLKQPSLRPSPVMRAIPARLQT